MGTRSLIMVVRDKTPKVAQYSQYEGEPNVTGIKILQFLSKANLTEFKEKLNHVKFTNDDKINEINKELDSICSNDLECVIKYLKDNYPFITHDIGASILQSIMDSTEDEIWLVDRSDFAANSLFCEWGYVVDLDKNTFEIYEGFQENPLDQTERFKYLEKTDCEYFPISLFEEYDLNNLPTPKEFSRDFNEYC